MNLEDKTDEELVFLAKQNGYKDKVFTKLYTKYKKTILNYSTFLCKDRELAKEITQDTFVKVYTSFGTYIKTRATFKTWIYTITKNTLMDYYKKQKIRDKFIINNNQVLHYENDPERKIIDKERFTTLEKEINSLKPIHKDVLNLQLNGYSYKEIVNKLNISMDLVKTRLFRGRELLKKRLDKKFFYQ